ncbi:hypothetical protein LCGC14_0801520 [marine sediment metagenome]|uniref:Uncharacterized protein n=1 Tax=marine sediment metagenome TaxID=412755 RepID=A0A0F9PU24_9ZZZZ
MSYKELLGKELNFNYDITFEEAFKRFPGISRENFDLIKYEYRRDVLGLKPKIKTKIKKKSNNYTEKTVKSEFHDQPKKTHEDGLIFDLINFIISFSEKCQEESIPISSYLFSALKDIEKQIIKLNQVYNLECIREVIKNFELVDSDSDIEPNTDSIPEPNDQEES